MNQHIAAAAPNADILHEFLTAGASVHLRNREGRTALFLAANAGLEGHVRLLMEAGAHLHSDEVEAARLHADGSSGEKKAIWVDAGIQG